MGPEMRKSAIYLFIVTVLASKSAAAIIMPIGTPDCFQKLTAAKNAVLGTCSDCYGSHQAADIANALDGAYQKPDGSDCLVSLKCKTGGSRTKPKDAEAGRDPTRGTDSVVSLDFADPSVPADDPGCPNPGLDPAHSLAHELAHAKRACDGLVGSANPAIDPEEQENAIQVENNFLHCQHQSGCSQRLNLDIGEDLSLFDPKLSAGDCCCGNVPCATGGLRQQSQTDAANCGACGNVCGPGAGCCSGACTQFSTDANNCGKCGNACPSGSICCNASCLPQSSLLTDPLNCGTCGNVCAGGMPCCNGTCANVFGSDPMNCGACGNACGAGQVCCVGVCSDLTDDYHCGQCGNNCGAIPRDWSAQYQTKLPFERPYPAKFQCLAINWPSSCRVDADCGQSPPDPPLTYLVPRCLNGQCTTSNCVEVSGDQWGPIWPNCAPGDSGCWYWNLALPQYDHNTYCNAIGNVLGQNQVCCNDGAGNGVAKQMGPATCGSCTPCGPDSACFSWCGSWSCRDPQFDTNTPCQ